MKQGLDVLDLREALSIRRAPEDAPARYRVYVENHHTGDFASHYADTVIVAAGTLNTYTCYCAAGNCMVDWEECRGLESGLVVTETSWPIGT